MAKPTGEPIRLAIGDHVVTVAHAVHRSMRNPATGEIAIDFALRRDWVGYWKATALLAGGARLHWVA